MSIKQEDFYKAWKWWNLLTLDKRQEIADKEMPGYTFEMFASSRACILDAYEKEDRIAYDNKLTYIHRLRSLVTDRNVNRILNVHNIAFIFYRSGIPLEEAEKYIQILASNIK